MRCKIGEIGDGTLAKPEEPELWEAEGEDLGQEMLQDAHDNPVDHPFQDGAEDPADIDLEDQFGDGPEDGEDLFEGEEVHVAELDEVAEEVVEREICHPHGDEGAAKLVEDDRCERALSGRLIRNLSDILEINLFSIEIHAEGGEPVGEFGEEFLRVEPLHGEVDDGEEERHAVFNDVIAENGADGAAGVFVDELDGEAADEPDHGVHVAAVEGALDGRNGLTASHLPDVFFRFIEEGAGGFHDLVEEMGDSFPDFGDCLLELDSPVFLSEDPSQI